MSPLSGWIDRFRGNGRSAGDAGAEPVPVEAAPVDPAPVDPVPTQARQRAEEAPQDEAPQEEAPTVDSTAAPGTRQPATEETPAVPSPFELLDEQPTASGSAATVDVAALHETVIATLREIYDPEIPVNIYDLGLIYRVDVSEQGAVDIDMTLTTPGCPVAATFPGTVESMVENIPEVVGAHVELVWDPPWTMDRMPEEVKLELGLL